MASPRIGSRMKKREEEEHQKLVSRMIAIAEGGAGFIAENPETNRGLRCWQRCEEKGKSGWQCDMKVQDMEDEP